MNILTNAPVPEDPEDCEVLKTIPEWMDNLGIPEAHIFNKNIPVLVKSREDRRVKLIDFYNWYKIASNYEQYVNRLIK